MDRATAAATAESLTALAADHPHIAARAQRLAERIRTGQFHVAVVGEFKRGKSTLINALLGAPVLPVGVLPLTAVATAVSHGEPGATVVYLDGRREQIGLDALGDYVTETANPDNRLGVARVEVHIDADLLRTGLVLVDTPGVGSIHEHNTTAALDAYGDADGAIVVLAADTPLSDAEHDTLKYFSGRGARTFVVLNKADHLAAAEVEQVRAFVAAAIADPEIRVWAVSARAALANATGGAPADDPGEFDQFTAAFAGFVDRDLAGERDAASGRELRRLADELAGLVRLELAAADLDTTTLAQRVDDLRRAASTERDAFAADRLLLADRTRTLATDLADRLHQAALAAARRRAPDLAAAAQEVPVSRLQDELRARIEQIVRDEFEQIMAAETEWLDRAWATLAEQFRDRARQRVDTVRHVAADLFAIDLPPIEIPELTSEPERFTYLFLHLPSTTEPIERLLARLVPGRWRLPRIVRRAAAELAQELDKHAGRARYDLTTRLDATRHHFDTAMTAAIDNTIDCYLAAATRGETLQQRGAAAIIEAQATLDRLDTLASSGPSPRPDRCSQDQGDDS